MYRPGRKGGSLIQLSPTLESASASIPNCLKSVRVWVEEALAKALQHTNAADPQGEGRRAMMRAAEEQTKAKKKAGRRIVKWNERKVRICGDGRKTLKSVELGCTWTKYSGLGRMFLNLEGSAEFGRRKRGEVENYITDKIEIEYVINRNHRAKMDLFFSSA